MRTTIALTMFTVLALAASASAEVELVIVGPVATTSSVPAAQVAAVKSELARSGFAPAGTAADAMCVLDTACLAKAGAAASSKQVMGVSVRTGTNKSVTIDVVLVDVQGIELIARRDLTGKPDTFGATLKQFVEQAPIERAKVLYDQGNKHYNLGEYAEALVLYKRAYRVKGLPAFLFNIAQCHRKLGQHTEAVAMYQSYLVGVPNADNKALVESLISESKDVLEKARLSADERARNESQTKQAEAARKAKEAEALAEQQRAEQARIEAERARDKTYNKHPARTPMLITGALGLVAGGVGGYFAYSARNKQESFDNAGCGDPDRTLGGAVLAQCIEDRDGGKRDALFGNVFIGSAAAVVVISAIVFAIDPGNVERPSATPRAQIGFSGRSIQVVLKW